MDEVDENVDAIELSTLIGLIEVDPIGIVACWIVTSIIFSANNGSGTLLGKIYNLFLLTNNLK